MQILRFDPEVARAIMVYDSKNASYLRIADEISNAGVGVMYIAAGGVIGYHQAIGDQLFMVVQGEGWVTGEDRQRAIIKTGQAAFWGVGEWHESGSGTGMTAVILEAADIHPALNEI